MWERVLRIAIAIGLLVDVTVAILALFFQPLLGPLLDVPTKDPALTTIAGEYRYRVLSTRIVRPDDVTVLDPGEKEILTLVTCYPFYFVGPAPDRFVVRAERVL